MTQWADEQWGVLGRRLAEARRAAEGRPTQVAIGNRIGVSLATVKSIERGRPYERVQPTHRAFAAAVGWADGSVEAVLAGGEPTLAGTSSQAEQAPQGDLLEGLPDLARLALTEGRAIDARVVSASPGDDREVVVVLKGRRRVATREELEDDIWRWEMVQLALRDILSKKRPKGD
jgi:DNA-binding XRE family transcriptional regulator